jgi:hypothetical protein
MFARVAAPAGRIFHPIWRGPYMTVNRHYVHDMLGPAGATTSREPGPLPDVTLDDAGEAPTDPAAGRALPVPPCTTRTYALFAGRMPAVRRADPPRRRQTLSWWAPIAGRQAAAALLS